MPDTNKGLKMKKMFLIMIVVISFIVISNAQDLISLKNGTYATSVKNNVGSVYEQSQVVTREEIYDGIKIIGNDAFILSTTVALNFIKQSPQHYRMVKENIKAIKQTKNTSVMMMIEQTFEVNDSHAFCDNYCYGSSIVHEANHAKQMQDYSSAHGIPRESVPRVVYYGEQAEMKCLKVQKDFLIAVGAPKSYLKWIDSAAATRWWEKDSR